MAGLSSTGLTIKRLREVIQDRVDSLRGLFGSDIDTSTNSVAGRMARVHADSERDLWELMELVYNSFNPDYAQGVSLDRIVQYGRLRRFEERPTTALIEVSGTFNITIPAGSFATSSVTNKVFVVDNDIVLDNSSLTEATIEIIEVVEGATYRIIAGDSTFEYVAQVGDTETDILNGLKTDIDSENSLNSTVDSEQIVVGVTNTLAAVDMFSSSNMNIVRASKLGDVSSQEVGPLEQPANTIDTVSTPVQGWDSVTNPFEASIGNFRESDDELRNRFQTTKELIATATVDGIRSSLTELIGVEDVNVYENVTETTDSLGLPPKSVAAVVLSGDPDNIAETIWRTKPAGISTFGDVDVNVQDDQGTTHTVSFSRPNTIDIYIDVTISSVEGALISNNIQRQIQEELTSYFEENYKVGDDVVYSRLYTPINRFSGYQVDSLTIGTSASPTGTSNITVAFNEIANLDRGNINVTVA